MEGGRGVLYLLRLVSSQAYEEDDEEMVGIPKYLKVRAADEV